MTICEGSAEGDTNISMVNEKGSDKDVGEKSEYKPGKQGLDILDPKGWSWSWGGGRYYAWSRPWRWAFRFY